MKSRHEIVAANRIVRFLGKPSRDIAKKDLISFVEKHGIEMVNFRYTAGDGKLKTLNFVVTSRKELDRLLSAGERVDGSSLFPYIDAASSDLYVVPRYRTAYVNPFSSIPAIDILCSFYTKDGEPLSSAPEHIVHRAHRSLTRKTGLTLEAMAELEYYVLFDADSRYPAESQRGYHASSPFAKWEALRCEAMNLIAQTGAMVKYGHSEVGSIRGEGRDMEQNEIEFQPEPIEDAAERIVIAKWILRMLGQKYGVTISFSPKVVVGHAGNGLHIHSRLLKGGKNVMLNGSVLSDTAKMAIAGYLRMASSLTAFGNTVPVSYLRLVPHQEAPTNVCWGTRNRSALVRVPLGWAGALDMIGDANPNERSHAIASNQTVEIRSPDGSADIHMLLAGLAVAARHGIETRESLAVAERFYVEGNVFAHANAKRALPPLPTSCRESADCLLQDRRFYEAEGVFTPAVIDGVAKKLRSYNDDGLEKRLKNRKSALQNLLSQYIHCA